MKIGSYIFMTGVVTGLRQRSGGGGRLEAVWPAWYSVVRDTGPCGQVYIIYILLFVAP